MKLSTSRSLLAALSTSFVISLTLALQGSTIVLTPSSPSVLVGQTVQLTATGAVVPVAMSTGAFHTCLMYSDSSIRCTGLNNQGEIGNNSYISVQEPALAIGTVSPARLLTGNEHTCTFIADGRMQCWGTNYTGQLGDGTIGGFAMQPQFVHNISNAIQGYTGGFHTCAMMADRTMQCWGRNQDGQLGNGDATTDMTLPVAVAGLGPIAEFAPGGYHNCAFMADHSVRCWGRNARGQVGDGTDITPVTQPHVVAGLTAASLSLGGFHSCALLPDATVQCWGQDDLGQVGTPGLALSKVPLTVNGLSGVTALASGFFHNCATLSDGTVRCWGSNNKGQLGDGTTANSAAPVIVAGISNPVSVDGGWEHSCALLRDASVWCWGGNDYGAFGNGTTTASLSPVQMHLTGLTWTSSNPAVATVNSVGVVTGVARGTATITVADPFGNTGSVAVSVKEMLALGVIRQGDGLGTVTSAPAGLNCPTVCSSTFVSDSQVTLTAAPQPRSLFTGWTGCDSVSGPTCTVTMANARTVNAIFMLQRFTLTVTKTGIGKGTVTSSPVGVNCGTGCASDFIIDTSVTLTATANLGSVLTGWTGCDTVNSDNTCTVRMSAAKTVNADFLGIPLQ